MELSAHDSSMDQDGGEGYAVARLAIDDGLITRLEVVGVGKVEVGLRVETLKEFMVLHEFHRVPAHVWDLNPIRKPHDLAI